MTADPSMTSAGNTVSSASSSASPTADLGWSSPPPSPNPQDTTSEWAIRRMFVDLLRAARRLDGEALACVLLGVFVGVVWWGQR